MTLKQMLAADTAARLVALTALDRTLLVEAGAGSGKTSVLAGRVAALLAAGRPPSGIAAITFTELAAGELRERVTAFVTELSEGTVRPDLRPAFPKGPTPSQRAALQLAREALDELTCTTIHGFCQRLLRPYPVEAGMDPGATVMDRADAEALFDAELDAWLRDRLSADAEPGDLLVALYLSRPAQTDALIRTVAKQKLRHRDAEVPAPESLADALAALRTAVAAFRSFVDGAGCHEPGTAAIIAELDEVIAAVPDTADEATHLLHLLDLPPPASCAIGKRKDEFSSSYKRLTKWRDALKAAGLKVKAEDLHQDAFDCYAACRAAHETVREYAAGRVLHAVAGELHVVLDRFAIAKSRAALIDFDDLMVKARDLLRDDRAVRDALSRRFPAILVDEFQDTDPIQTEILWRLCAAQPDASVPWMEWPLRPGALFLVGDPKQAIYRFRGADVGSYTTARDRMAAVDPKARVVIAQNFRSLGSILDWVNERFQPVFTNAPQPGFEALFSTTPPPPGHVALATLPVPGFDPSANGLRDAEADAVAALCSRIIGALAVRGREGMRPCRPDDIALLAPTGTELWRYERALEQVGIAVSTQAGKGFYRRQEVQDLLALTRVLADSSDTLALGAFLRGPLVGLTEEELLDATFALPPREGAEDGTPGHLRLWTPLTDIRHELLRQTIETLQSLARRAGGTTPFVLLSQAVEELQVRALLRQRQDRTAERALANLDQFLEAARAYDMRGLLAFTSFMRMQWVDGQRDMEGRPDTEQQSVSIVTMHSSKGLEWPVVIPINMGTAPQNRVAAALDPTGRLHVRVFGRHAAGSEVAHQAEVAAEDQQRHRLWYVAATRARDLLLLPAFETGVPKGSFMEKVGLDLQGLEAFAAEAFDGRLVRTEEELNTQDRERFLTEAALIASRRVRVRRVTPHLAEAGEAVPQQLPSPPTGSDEDPDVPLDRPRGGQARGLVLHKLIEEVLTGELTDDADVLTARAAILKNELSGTSSISDLDPAEVACTVRRTLGLAEVAALRSRLVPEYAVASSQDEDGTETVTIGVADAVTLNDDGSIGTVVDWKSDVAPSPATLAHYRGQVAAYLEATGCEQGLIVMMTSGVVHHVAVDRTA